MDPLAAIPSYPTAWIASGVVTPVAGSPAAAAATAWAPQPVVTQAAPTATTAMLDAIANSLLGIDYQPVVAAPGFAPVAHTAATGQQELVAAQQHEQLLQQQHAVAAQQQLAMQAAAAPVAPAPVAVPAPRTAAADPTLVSSVAGALSGFAAATGTAVGSGVSRVRKALRTPGAIHISQVTSKYNPAPASGNRDCGPASVAMTLRLLGKNIPGVAANAAPQKLINRVRQLAGNVSNRASTTNHELERALTAAGTQVREIADAASVRQAVLDGKPVILNGNPRHPGAYGPKFSAKQMTPYNGAHWIVVSGYDAAERKFIINDPLSKIGPVKVTPAQLEAYRGGSMGIEVAA